jgi:ankyrin repeat protein
LPGRFPLGGPLHFAAFFDDANFVEALLKVFKIPINFTGSSESTALEFAVPRRRVLASTLLISEGALDPEASNTYVLMEIGTRLPHETLAIAGITQTQTAVLTSTCLDLVLDRRPELLNSNSSDGWTPLMGAVDYHDRETVKALICHGCDLNAATSEKYEGMTALHFITRTKFHFKDDDILELLRDAGADFSARTLLGGKRVLHFAARDDCPFIATKILNLDQANLINATTVPFGETALHIAAAYGSYKVARLLLEKGADTEIGHLKGTYHERDWDNLTPLAVAATKSRKQMVELLLEYGASGLARPRSKHSILHFAVTERHSTMMQMLLEISRLATSEVVDARASNGLTALHFCAGNLGRHEHLSLLLKAGADVSVYTDTGHSALDIAYQTRDLLRGALVRGDSTDLNDGGECIAEISDLCDAILVPNTRIKIVGVRGVSLGDSDNPGSPFEKNCMDDEVREDKVDLDISMENAQREGSSFDLVEELRRWHVSIKRLEEYGSKRCCSDPFPRVLLSLNPSDQQSGGTLLVQMDVADV